MMALLARQTVLPPVITFVLVAMFFTLATPALAEESIPYFKPEGKLSYKLDLLSQTRFRSKSRSTQAKMLGIMDTTKPTPGGLMQTTDGKIVVDLFVTDTDQATLDAIAEAGADILHVSARYAVITAAVATNQLDAIAALPAVKNITESPIPIRNQADCAKATTTDGDVQLKADLLRDAMNIDGTGVKVGALSDSFDSATNNPPTNASDDIGTGDLPGQANPCNRLTDVVVLQSEGGASSPTDEGRAMLQIVHDIAPGAQLGFASAYPSIYTFADNIRALRDTFGADVIVDDVNYLYEPMFQEGPVSTAAQEVVNDGAVYFASAGNFNVEVDVNGQSQAIGSYETANFRTTPCPATIATLGKYNACHDFDPGTDADNTSGFTLSSGGYISFNFQWNQPWFGVTEDLDIFMLDNSGNILAQSTNTQLIYPYEGFTIQNTTDADLVVRFVVARANGTTSTPRFKYIMFQSSGIESAEWTGAKNTTDMFGPTLFGHNSSAAVMSVAAMSFQESQVESFSSRGDSTLYYNPVNGQTPATALPAPVTVHKPDFTATDGAKNTFFGSPGNGAYYFFGTSAAAPHAGAVAALLLEVAANTGQTLDQAGMEELLENTATTIDGNPKASGAGLINALAAGESLQSGDPLVALLSVLIILLN
ncbi:S8 family peptidase [Desulfovibrio inopinatus]|uniref:S8 family peptidase n=1 Tax=Desulfovibrio inopinatus TaxID=102109 RepID=UPI0004067C4E|nr:S8 family serine peptidase [Desulfovibrio inopinatus]